MDVPFTSMEVITQIQKLHNQGNSLRKKEVKQLYPDLMRSAVLLPKLATCHRRNLNEFAGKLIIRLINELFRKI